MNGHDPRPTTWWDRLFVALVACVVVLACAMMVSECAALIVDVLQ